MTLRPHYALPLRNALTMVLLVAANQPGWAAPRFTEAGVMHHKAKRRQIRYSGKRVDLSRFHFLPDALRHLAAADSSVRSSATKSQLVSERLLVSTKGDIFPNRDVNRGRYTTLTTSLDDGRVLGLTEIRKSVRASQYIPFVVSASGKRVREIDAATYQKLNDGALRKLWQTLDAGRMRVNAAGIREILYSAPVDPRRFNFVDDDLRQVEQDAIATLRPSRRATTEMYHAARGTMVGITRTRRHTTYFKRTAGGRKFLEIEKPDFEKLIKSTSVIGKDGKNSAGRTTLAFSRPIPKDRWHFLSPKYREHAMRRVGYTRSNNGRNRSTSSVYWTDPATKRELFCETEVRNLPAGKLGVTKLRDMTKDSGAVWRKLLETHYFRVSADGRKAEEVSQGEYLRLTENAMYQIPAEPVKGNTEFERLNTLLVRFGKAHVGQIGAESENHVNAWAAKGTRIWNLRDGVDLRLDRLPEGRWVGRVRDRYFLLNDNMDQIQSLQSTQDYHQLRAKAAGLSVHEHEDGLLGYGPAPGAWRKAKEHPLTHLFDRKIPMLRAKPEFADTMLSRPLNRRIQIQHGKQRVSADIVGDIEKHPGTGIERVRLAIYGRSARTVWASVHRLRLGMRGTTSEERTKEFAVRRWVLTERKKRVAHAIFRELGLSASHVTMFTLGGATSARHSSHAVDNTFMRVYLGMSRADYDRRSPSDQNLKSRGTKGAGGFYTFQSRRAHESGNAWNFESLSTLVHEALHALSAPIIEQSYGSHGPLIEGFTEYFARRVAVNQLRERGHSAYDGNVRVVIALASLMGVDALRDSFFGRKKQGLMRGLGKRVDQLTSSGTFEAIRVDMEAGRFDEAIARINGTR